jgi:hypothetical protein
MDRTKTTEREINFHSIIDNNLNDFDYNKNLEILISENSKFENHHNNTNEEMKNPLSFEKAFSYFGLMLGSIPPATIFSLILFENGKSGFNELGLVIFLLFVNVVTAIVGFFTGKIVGDIAQKLESKSWSLMILVLPFVGLLWGLISGAAGGVFIFIIGAVFGGMIGAMVGGLALPVFTILHRLLKQNNHIELKYFLPISLGLTFIISAFILGM